MFAVPEPLVKTNPFKVIIPLAEAVVKKVPIWVAEAACVTCVAALVVVVPVTKAKTSEAAPVPPAVIAYCVPVATALVVTYKTTSTSYKAALVKVPETSPVISTKVVPVVVALEPVTLNVVQPPVFAAEVKFVPSEVITLPEVEAVVGKVGVEAT